MFINFSNIVLYMHLDAQVYYTVKNLVISFIVFEILTIITLIGQLTN